MSRRKGKAAQKARKRSTASNTQSDPVARLETVAFPPEITALVSRLVSESRSNRAPGRPRVTLARAHLVVRTALAYLLTLFSYDAEPTSPLAVSVRLMAVATADLEDAAAGRRGTP